MKTFIDNDKGYLDWVERNKNGFVLNTDQRQESHSKLHRASCWTIKGVPPRGKEWTATYIKICSLDKKELKKLARGKLARGESLECGKCNP